MLYLYFGYLQVQYSIQFSFFSGDRIVLRGHKIHDNKTYKITFNKINATKKNNNDIHKTLTKNILLELISKKTWCSK